MNSEMVYISGGERKYPILRKQVKLPMVVLLLGPTGNDTDHCSGVVVYDKSKWSSDGENVKPQWGVGFYSDGWCYDLHLVDFDEEIVLSN